MPLSRLLLPALVACVAAGAHAQPGALLGTVTDAETRAPLQGVSVGLYADDALRTGTATDADGAFLLRRVPPGRYTLRLRFVGYEPTEAGLTLAPGETQRLSFTLAADTTALGDVFVERAAPGGAAGVSAGYERISAADIADVPMPGTSGDLAAYLQTSTAVTAVGDRGGQLYVRGGAPAQTLVRLDGLRLSRPFHVLGFFSAVPSEIVDEVDLYTGAYPARYGGRLSSVLDIRARGGNKERVAASAGVAPALSAVHLELPIAPGRVSTLVSVRESLIERVFPRWVGQRLPYRFGDAFVKADALLGAQARASVSFVSTHDRGDVAGTFVDFLGNRQPIDQSALDSLSVQWSEEAIGGQVEWFPTSVPLRVRASVSTHRSASGFGPETLEDDFDGVPDTDRNSGIAGTEAMLDAVWAVAGAEVRLGASAYDAETTYRVADRFTDLAEAELPYSERAAYAEVDVPLGGGLSAGGGVRVEEYGTAEQTAVSPNARLRWAGPGVIEEAALAAGVYRQGLVGIRDNRDVGDVFTALVPVGPGEVLPRAEHLVASVRGAVPGVRAAVEGYVKRFPDLLVSRLDPAPAFTTVLDPASGEAYGFDVRAEHRRTLGPDATLSVRAGYAYSNVTYETERAGGTEAFPPSHDQRHAATGLARVDVGPFAVYAVGQIHSGFPYTPSAGFDEYVPVGGGVDVSEEPGTTRVIYGARGSRRLPTYARLDLWMERSASEGRLTTTLRAGVVNVLNRDNVFYFDLFTLRRVDQLPFFPSLGVKIEVQ